jgi:hypothetical protein
VATQVHGNVKVRNELASNKRDYPCVSIGTTSNDTSRIVFLRDLSIRLLNLLHVISSQTSLLNPTRISDRHLEILGFPTDGANNTHTLA